MPTPPEPETSTFSELEHEPASAPTPRHSVGAAALFGALLYALLAAMSIALSRLPGSVATLWFANMAGALLVARRPAREAWVLLPALVLGNQATNLLMVEDWRAALAFALPNLVEVALTVHALRRVKGDIDLLSSPARLLLVLLTAGLIPAMVGATLGAAMLAGSTPATFGFVWPRWLEGSLIGAISMLPLALFVLMHGVRVLWRQLCTLENGSLLLLSAAVALVVPVSVPFPFVYITLPLALAALRGGFAVTACACLLVSVLTGAQIGLGLLIPPPTTLHWEHVLFYLPILAVVVPPTLLASAMEGYRRSLRELRTSERRLRTLYSHTPALMMSFLPDGRLLSVSDLWLNKLGRSGPEVLGQPFTDFMPAESAQTIQARVLPELLQRGHCRDVACRWVTGRGELIESRLSAVWERNARGQPTRALAVIEDVTENQRLAHFAAQREFIEVTLHSIGDGVVACDAEGRIQYLNPVAEALLGVQRQSALGHAFDQTLVLLDPETGLRIDNPVLRCLRTGRGSGLPREALMRGLSGPQHPIQHAVSPIFGPHGQLRGAVMVFQDVREARALEQRMAHLAHHDALTDLPNRVLLQDRIQQACERSRREGGGFGVMFLDLDHFKHVNDSLGHAAGDELLREMARRLKTTLRTCDTICRLGGDEFVMLVGDIQSPQDLGAVAEKVLSEVAQPCQIAGREMNMSVSLGLALFPADGENVEVLMKHADTAMYRAKREGRNRYHFFSRSLDEAATVRLQLEHDIRQGIATREFIVHYQPLVRARDGAVIGAEALVRWQRGPQDCWGPGQFITVAEESGLIVALGEQVLEMACAQLRQWQDLGLPVQRLCVNVSPLQFAAAGFVERVLAQASRHHINPALLELEITEASLMRHPEQTREALRRLKAAGIKVALDDFGTGYSSLSYLHQFPVDTLKIDRSFVAEMHQSADNQQLVAAIVAMTATLKLHVVAEGVETQAQAALLADMGCDTLQGFLFARPMPAAAMAVWLGRRWPTETPSTPPGATAESSPALQHDLASGAP